MFGVVTTVVVAGGRQFLEFFETEAAVLVRVTLLEKPVKAPVQTRIGDLGLDQFSVTVAIQTTEHEAQCLWRWIPSATSAGIL